MLLFYLFLSEALSSGVLEENKPTICDPGVKQYSGYFKLTTSKLTTKNYFYWFFESRSAPSTDPVLLWLTGGPGCSSEVALFGENGPCKVSKDGNSTTLNDFSWNTNANLLYVDQPTGTGFSYGTGLDHSEAGVAADMYDFLQQFFKTHTEYSKLDFYAFGESYAGHYIPAVTHQIWKNNNNLPRGAITINLKGTSVGNGLVDPEVQYGYYPEMAISTNHHNASVSHGTYLVMKAAVPVCTKLIKNCQHNVTACVEAIDVCNIAEMMPYQATGLNPYDMREKCAVPPLCYDFSNVATYLGKDDVKEQLGVKGRKWSDCNHEVAMLFELSGDWMKNFQTQIPDQLNAGIRVLIYAGDQDYICNWLGNQAWAKNMDWTHKADFNAAKVTDWKVNGTSAGTLQTSNGFSFLRVYDAGHMVPMNQPKNALEMVRQFINAEI